MQQVQRRELPERISWARAMIFGVGFFFISAILIGQLPGYIYLQVTASSLEGMERGSLGLAVVCLGSFAIIQVIVLLFDPKPVVSPIVVTVLGAIFALGGLALTFWATTTGCSDAQPACNQYFPSSAQNAPTWAPVLGGKVLWFQPQAVDFVMVGLALLGVGVAWVFYSQLAIREQRNPDRRDMGTTPAIRWMIVIASIMMVMFMVFYTLYDNQGLATAIDPANVFSVRKVIDFITCSFLGVAIFLVLGAFALRLHYLMRPVRKRTMSGLYAIGALGLAHLGLIFLLAWFLVYPAVAWMHSWTFIGLNDYLTICARKTAIPQSCSFSPQFGYIVDGIISMTFFTALMAAIWAWKSHRNLVVIGSVITTAVIAFATLLIHTAPDQILVSLLLTGGMLILAAIWTSVSRREFAIVGENNLGCLGQWLVVGTCLLIYLTAFAFFSIPLFSPETEPNVPFISGAVIPPPAAPNQPPVIPASDAVVMLVLMGILAAIQFYFLARNRYKV